MKVQYKVLYNKNKRFKADGTAQIVIELYLKSKKKYIDTGLSVSPGEWNLKSKRVNQKNLHYAEYNLIINDLLLRLEDFELRILSEKK